MLLFFIEADGLQWFKPYECDILLTHIVTQLIDPALCI